MALEGERAPQIKAVFDALGMKPRIAVETGTWVGNTTAALSTLFDMVFTVELSSKYFHDAVDRFREVDHILCLFGDSADVVRKLSGHIEEPVMWYLDAHYPDGWPEGQKEYLPTTSPMPLFDELRAISERRCRDIVIVDDIHAFGRGGLWADVTVDNLVDIMKPRSTFRMKDSFAMLLAAK